MECWYCKSVVVDLWEASSLSDGFRILVCGKCVDVFDLCVMEDLSGLVLIEAEYNE